MLRPCCERTRGRSKSAPLQTATGASAFIRRLLSGLVLTVTAAFAAPVDVDRALAEFDQRRAQAFASGLELINRFPPLPKQNWQSRTSQQPDWRRYAIPRLQHAVLSLCVNRDVAAANDLVVSTCHTLAEDTARYTGGPSGLHWSGSLLLRLYFLFGPKGTMTANRLSPAALSAMEELLWRWTDAETRIDDADPRRVWESWASENHAAMHHGLSWGATAILANSAKYGKREFADGFLPAERHAAETDYAKWWLSERGQRGLLVEIASNSYSAATLRNWYDYHDFATDPELRRLAENLLHLWWADCAHELLDGVRGGGKSRESRGRSDDWSGLAGANAQLAWCTLGVGKPPGIHLSAYLSIFTSAYRVPRVIAELALDVEGRGSFVYESRRPGLAVPQYTFAPQPASGRALHQHFHWIDRERGGIRRYTYVTPDYIVGGNMLDAVPFERWTRISDSNRWSGVILRGHPDARTFAQCDVVATDRYGNARGANEHGTLQETSTLIWQKLRESRNFLATKIYFPALLQPLEERGVIFGRQGDAFVAARPAVGGYQRISEPWLKLDDDYSPVIFEVGSAARDGSFEKFRASVHGAKLTREGDALHYVRARDGRKFTVYLGKDRTGAIDGKPTDFDPPFTYRSPFIEAAWPATTVKIQKGGQTLELDFRLRKRSAATPYKP